MAGLIIGVPLALASGRFLGSQLYGLNPYNSEVILVAVFLTEGYAKFTFPDGKSKERSWKAGDSQLMPGEQHLPENLSDRPLELILVELKG